MRKTFLNMATACVVALLALAVVSSCVNAEYELSEENLNTEVTVFQEGLSIPLGSTARITMESLTSMLDEDTKEMIKEMEGAYMFSMSDTYDLSEDIQKAFSGISSLESIPLNEKFSFSLSNIDLSVIKIEGRPIGTEDINISDKLNVPDINGKLPKIQESMPGLSIALPKLNENDLNLNIGNTVGNVEHVAPVISLGDGFSVPDAVKTMPEYTKDMLYNDIRNHSALKFLGLQLPELQNEYGFQDYTVKVPIKITLPKEIKSVEDIKLHDNARFEMVLTMMNPLFTEGSFTPHLLINLHDLFHVDKIMSGMQDGGYTDHDGINHHIHDNFVMNHKNGWTADHIYHIEKLAFEDWKGEWTRDGNGSLVLDKEIEITLSGNLEVKPEELKTNLELLNEYGGNPMSLKVDIRFFDFKVEDVVMSIEPKTMQENLAIDFEVPQIKMPEMIKKVDYVEFDKNSPLELNMSANIPEVCDNMDLSLQSLKLEFPKGVVVDHDDVKDAGEYDPVTRTLVYSGVDLSKGLNERIRIARLNFDDLSNGSLSYSGQVKVTADARAEGKLSSKSLLQSTGNNNLSVDVSVNYAPQLSDYCVHTADYSYDVKVEPVIINSPIDDDVAEMFKGKPVTAKLKQVDGENPKIVINLDYPTDIPVINILPKKGEGLKLDFPDMINFSAASLAGLDHDPQTNSISFTETDRIPREIVLEITGITVLPEKVDDKYFIMDRMEVSGGVYVAAAEIHKADVEAIVNSDAMVRFGAEIPTLSPAEIGLDEYELPISEKVEVDGIEVELPDVINSIKVSELALKDVYLSLDVDASKITEIVGDAMMNIVLDVVLPDILNAEGVDNGKLHIEQEFKNGLLAIKPVRILGLNLSEIDAADGKLVIDAMSVSVDGSVKVKDMTVDMDALEGKNIEVSIAGGLSTHDAEGKPTDGIEIERIAGNIGFGIEPVETTVDLSEIAEMFNGEKMSVTLDVNTFWLNLNIKTNLDIPVNGNLEIIPYYGEEAGVAKVVDLNLDPAKRGEDGYRIYISNKDPETAGLTFVELDLMSLLYKKVEGQKPVMASSLKVNLSAGTDPEKECVINPSEEYVLTADYTVGVPLELGADFSVEYRDVISDLPEIAGQLLSYGSIGLDGKITNGLPFRFDLQLRLLDSMGNEIPMKESAGTMVISPCDPTGAPVDTDISLVLGGVDKSASDLHSIEFVFTADSKGAAGVPVKPDSFLQVTALSLLIPEGVSVDLGDYLLKEDGQDEETNE